MKKFILINKKNLGKTKRGQAWSFDLVMACFIFLVGIIALYVYAINYSSQAQQHLDQLYYEGTVASDLILGEEDFGILTNGKVNQTKLDEYGPSGYATKKDQLGVIYDFYFSMNGEDFGRLNTTQTDSLIKITRITIYKLKPTKFELFIYDE
jgi:hypothetical protein